MRSEYMRDNIKAGRVIKTRRKCNFYHKTMFDFVPYIHDFVHYFCILEKPYIASLFPNREREPTKDELPNIFLLFNIMKFSFAIRIPNGHDYETHYPRFCQSSLEIYERKIFNARTRFFDFLHYYMKINNHQLSEGDFNGMISNIFYLLNTQI